MLKKIAITGPESTGKSTLSRELAQYFSTNFVPEFARTYLTTISRPYCFDDLLIIAQNQMLQEDEMAEKTTRFLFIDTELTVIDIWSQEKYGKTDAWILDELQIRTYDLILIPDIDLAWEDDPQRENPQDRERLLGLYQDSFNSRNIKYYMIKGQAQERLTHAIQLIQQHFNI